MNKTTHRIAKTCATLLGVVTLYGCSAPPPAQRSAPAQSRDVASTMAKPARTPPSIAATGCNPGICKLRIYVNDDYACGDPEFIVVSPSYVSVSRDPGGNPDPARNMHWKIDTAGFEFAPLGIVFDPDNGEFEVTHSSARELHFKNKNSLPGPVEYKYTVYLKPTGVGSVCPLDPFIRNNN